MKLDENETPRCTKVGGFRVETIEAEMTGFRAEAARGAT